MDLPERLTENTGYLCTRLARRAMAPPDPDIPADIIRERGDLSLQQAIVHYLCDDPDGPELTQEAAAEAIGTTRDQLWIQLRRARDKLDDA